MLDFIYQIRAKFLITFVDWTKPFYAKVFKFNKRAWVYTREDLLRMPRESLGRLLGEFLLKNDYHLLAKMEDHDVMHVLMEFKTTVEDEVKMQYFLIGNGKKSIYAWFTIIFGSLMIPEFFKEYFQAFRKGKSCHNISNWDFQYLLGEPIELLQRQINKQSCPNGPIIF